ncbi:MAG: hypothetical protein HRT35_33390 [Algicola sp.]|nr:hypothetical protein [Algicola sp.]
MEISSTLDQSNILQEKSKSPSKLKKFGRKALIGLIGFIVLFVVVDRIWVASGSNQWVLKQEEKGIKIYTLKTPGASIIKVKAVKNFNMTLSNIIAPFLDETIQDDCAAWVEGCLEYRILKPWNPKLQTNLQMWRIELPAPLSPREMLVQGQIYQNPDTKVVTLENLAAPNNIEPSEGFVRIRHFHNIWHYTPLANGEVIVELVQDFDMSGFFPDFLLNLAGPSQLFKMFDEELPELLGREKYVNTTLDFIEEL